jgi:hypothetical protein
MLHRLSLWSGILLDPAGLMLSAEGSTRAAAEGSPAEHTGGLPQDV